MRLFTTEDFDRFAQLSEENLDDRCVVLVNTPVPVGGGVETPSWDPDPAFPDPLPCRVTARDLTPQELAVALQRKVRVLMDVTLARGVMVQHHHRLQLTITILGVEHTLTMGVLAALPDPSQVGQLVIVEGPV